jgi:SAM-dependent methyltransferase
MFDDVKKEKDSHGRQWNTLHGGYFSDPEVASPLVKVIFEAIRISRAEVIVDFGGGTGFLLHELIRNNVAPDIRLVDVDISERQLAAICHDLIVPVQAKLTEFTRGDADSEAKRFLFIMRSALHYHGRKGLAPLLKHLRSQMKSGEFFIHQTACFERVVDARLMNTLYKRMGTGKWYPTVGHLCECLEKAGWKIRSASPAMALPLTSKELGRRYGLGKDRLFEIRDDLAGTFGERKEVFSLRPGGFIAYLHYRIFTCVASR